MHDERSLGLLVRRVTSQVRWRRGEHAALRGAFYGAVLAVVPVLVKEPLDRWALPVAGALFVGSVVAGLVWGLSRPVAPLDAARLADRAFGLRDRVATAIEWSRRPDRTPLVDALIADAVARVAELPRRQIVGRIVPGEARWLVAPVAVAVALAVAPALRLPSGQIPGVSTGGDAEETADRGEMATMDRERRPMPRDPLRRPGFEERDMVQRSGGAAASTSGDLSAVFKDTALATQRPDFNSFLRKGDDRLKMLERVDRLPDLQSDYTSSQYKMVFRKAKALTSGLRPDQISPQKLRELLEEMERLGRKGGNVGQDVSEGMDALEYGQQDKAMEAMEKALNKLRAMEDQQRAGKNLRGGRESDRGRKGERGRGGNGPGPEDQDFGEGEGLLPGKGKSPSPKGEASQRLRASPYDAGVEGESRRGRKDGYDTNMTGRGASAQSRLQYLGVIGQYRKLMEDTIAREQVPREYHTQIKDYFQALDER